MMLVTKSIRYNILGNYSLILRFGETDKFQQLVSFAYFVDDRVPEDAHASVAANMALSDSLKGNGWIQ